MSVDPALIGFSGLLESTAELCVGQVWPYVVGETLDIRVPVEDENGLMTFSTGYTATMTLNAPDGTNVATFADVATGGRQIQFTPNSDWSFRIFSTPAGMAAVEAYVGHFLRFNVAVTQGATGVVATPVHNCFLHIYSQND